MQQVLLAAVICVASTSSHAVQTIPITFVDDTFGVVGNGVVGISDALPADATGTFYDGQPYRITVNAGFTGGYQWFGNYPCSLGGYGFGTFVFAGGSLTSISERASCWSDIPGGDVYLTYESFEITGNRFSYNRDKYHQFPNYHELTNYSGTVSGYATAVPEPETWSLLGAGLSAVILRQRFRPKRLSGQAAD